MHFPPGLCKSKPFPVGANLQNRFKDFGFKPIYRRRSMPVNLQAQTNAYAPRGCFRWKRRGSALSRLGLLLWLAGIVPAHAFYRSDPDYLIDTWETQQGMPDNSATAIVQAADGYLWIGTFNGLVQFDGVKFKVYDHSNVPELPSPGIVNLHLDKAGRLWVSTLQGLVTRQAGRWTKYPREGGWTGDYARTFSENAGVVCITSFDGKVFRSVDGLLHELSEPPGQKGRGYFGQVDADGRIWVAQDHFFGWWDGQKWVRSKMAEVVTNGFVAASQARDGSLLVLTGAGLLRFQGERLLSQTAVTTSIGGVWRMDEDRHGAVWVSTMETGLFRVSNSGVRHYSSTNGLTSDPLRCTFEDREHNIWVGTSGGGLERFRPRIFCAFDNEAGLPERNIRAVIEEQPGEFLVGTYGKGTVRLQSGRVSWLFPRDGARTPSYILSLLQDRQGGTWLGTPSGLFLLSNQHLRRVPSAQSGGERIPALFEDSQGRVWIAGNQTVSLWSQGEFNPFPTNSAFNLGGIRHFAESPLDHSIWAGGSDGLFRYEKGKWSEIKNEDDESLSDIFCLRFEPDGTLWVGGAETGLLRLQRGRWSTVGEAQGLNCRGITCLLDDGLGYWWMACTRGVVRAAHDDLERAADGVLSRLTCQVFNESDGMPGVESPQGYQSASLKDGQGRLWFATLRGLAMVDPKAIYINTNPPPVIIDWVRLEDFSNQQRTIDAFGPAPVLIPSNTREIKIGFSALSYSAPEKMRFAYRIEGVDSDWKDLENRRALYFYPPAPGTYSVRIKAANNDGIWNEQGASLCFKVQPSLWQSLWFRFGAVGALLGCTAIVGWQVGRARLQSKIQRLEELRALETERARMAEILEQSEAKLRQSQKMEAIGQLAGGVAHDFNNLLCVIRGNADLVLMNPGGLGEMGADCLKQITAASDRAANLTRQLLAFSRKQVMESVPLNLTGVIGNLTKMLKRIIGEDIQLRCASVERLPFVCADVGMIEQVLVNLVVNARDAMPRGGQLVISTDVLRIDAEYVRNNPEARQGQFVCLSVADTGLGIAPEHLPHIFEPFFTTKAPGQGTGLGLATVYGIIKQHQGWIEVASQLGAGSTFKIFLPVIDMPEIVPTAQPVESKPRGGHETILVVEDDDAVRSLTRRILEGFGYRTVEACSGREALAQWANRASEIDLLMTDMVMPEGITGRELAEQMRARRPALKVLFVSGYSPEVAGKDTEFIRHNGPNFLQKPVPPRQLLETVRQCLDSNGSRSPATRESNGSNAVDKVDDKMNERR